MGREHDAHHRHQHTGRKTNRNRGVNGQRHVCRIPGTEELGNDNSGAYRQTAEKADEKENQVMVFQIEPCVMVLDCSITGISCSLLRLFAAWIGRRRRPPFHYAPLAEKVKAKMHCFKKMQWELYGRVHKSCKAVGYIGGALRRSQSGKGAQAWRKTNRIRR